MFDNAPRIHVSIDQKVGLPNYGSASVSMSLSQVPFDATEEDIRAMLATQKVVYNVLLESLREKISLLRKENGFS